MTIYLLKKTHPKTGLMYLCKTVRNPFKYKGSGKDWLPHLRQYGDDHYTEIIQECQSKEEFKYWGRYYSRLWNIVTAQDDYGNKIWANQKIEGGDGGSQKGAKQNRRPEYKSIPAIIVSSGETIKASPSDARWKSGEIVGINKGRQWTAECRKKNSEGVSKLKWWNNGTKSIRSKECPGSDYVRGRKRVHW